jgi:hypothetical protein
LGVAWWWVPVELGPKSRWMRVEADRSGGQEP